MPIILGSFAMLYVVVAILAFVGWVWNIGKLVGLVGGEVTAELVVRGVGVFFAPLGAIYGWF